MLRLLLCLCLLPHLAGAALVDYSGSVTLDITACPLTYFGQQYSTLYVDLELGRICFGSSASAGEEDCIETPALADPGAFKADVGVLSPNFDTDISAEITHITTASTCSVQLQIGYGGTTQSELYFVSFGTQTALHMDLDLSVSASATFAVRVNGKGVVYSKNYPNGGTQTKIFDLTGCQNAGSTYAVGDKFSSSPETCVNEVCQGTGSFQTQTCTIPNQCFGSNVCGVRRFCSVIGSSIIDFNDHHATVPDFCHYTLLDAGITVKGGFKARRVTDVPMLDNVVITKDLPIYLSRGGVVLVTDSNSNKVEVTLTSTPTTYQGVDLSKDEDGVTAVYTDASNIRTTIFFDGTLLHITREAPDGVATPSGACGDDSQAFSTYKELTLSEPGCETVTPDPDADGINCNAVVSRCNIQLDGCEVSPYSYNSACANLLCNYPESDGLYCDFLHSYARSCQLPDWRTQDSVDCPVSSCVDHVCGENEFCGERNNGAVACLCRDSFGAEYRSANTYGPEVCQDNAATVTLYTCFLEEIGVDYSGLSLTDPSCTGVHNAAANSVTFSFTDTNTCGAILSAEGNQIVLKNQITNRPSDIITREDQATFTFSCAYTQKEPQTLSLKIADNSVVHTFTSGDFTFTLTMSAFTNAGLTQAVVASTALNLNQQVWVQLEAQGVDTEKLALVIDDCWATSESSPTAANRYDLITNGCPSDATVQVVSTGETRATTFSYHIFQFVGSSNDVFLHCQVNLCIKANGCVPDCTPTPSRRRRSVQNYQNEKPALITMAWSN